MLWDTARCCTPCPVSCFCIALCYAQVTFTLRGQLATTFQQPPHGTSKTRQALRWHTLHLHLHTCTRDLLLSLWLCAERKMEPGRHSPLQHHAVGRKPLGPGCSIPLDSERYALRGECCLYIWLALSQLVAPLHLRMSFLPKMQTAQSPFLTSFQQRPHSTKRNWGSAECLPRWVDALRGCWAHC